MSPVRRALLAAAALLAAGPASAVEVVRISVLAAVAEVELSGQGLTVESLREGAERHAVPGGACARPPRRRRPHARRQARRGRRPRIHCK